MLHSYFIRCTHLLLTIFFIDHQDWKIPLRSLSTATNLTLPSPPINHIPEGQVNQCTLQAEIQHFPGEMGLTAVTFSALSASHEHLFLPGHFYHSGSAAVTWLYDQLTSHLSCQQPQAGEISSTLGGNEQCKAYLQKGFFFHLKSISPFSKQGNVNSKISYSNLVTRMYSEVTK